MDGIIAAAGRMTATGFGIYLCVVGAMLAAIGAGLLVKRLRIASGDRVQGQIVAYVQPMAQRGSQHQYMPVVRFAPRGSLPVEFQSRMGANPKHWPVGTAVPVAYRPERPDHAEIATAARLWVAPPVIIALGLACFAIAWKVGR